MTMKIQRLNNYYTDENTYLVYDGNTALVIDPGYKTDGILKAAADAKTTIQYILITHCHYDHIEFMEDLREKTNAKLVSGDKASINITDPDINLTLAGFGKAVSAKKSDIILKDGETLPVGNMQVKCIYTPGHTNCGTCYLIKNHLFSGDTLFLRNCGRWDLPTGDEETLIRSVKNKIYTLDDEIIIHPGHGEQTTVGYEKKFNLYIKE